MSPYWDKRREIREIIIKIFNDIDILIESCKSSNPVPFNASKFRQEYERLKKRWLN